MDTDWYHSPKDGETVTQYFISKSTQENIERENERTKTMQGYRLNEFGNSKPKGRRKITKVIRFRQPLTLGIGLSYYNDKQGLRRMLGSVFGTLPCADEMPNFEVKVLAVDGPYKGFLMGNQYSHEGYPSDDGSTMLVDHFLPAWERQFPMRWQQPNAEIVHRHSKGVFTEFEKRNQYIQMAKAEKCDFLLVMDSDEYFQRGAVNWENFAKELDYIRQNDPNNSLVYNVAMYDIEQKYPCFRPRLFYKPERLQYSGSHRNVVSKKSGLQVMGQRENIPQPYMEIWHESRLSAPT